MCRSTEKKWTMNSRKEIKGVITPHLKFSTPNRSLVLSQWRLVKLIYNFRDQVQIMNTHRSTRFPCQKLSPKYLLRDLINNKAKAQTVDHGV